jgi:flagellar export protein FliJ
VAAKSLKTLLRLSRFTVDEKRRVLVELQAREDQILANITAAEAQLIEEQRIAAEDSTGAGFLYGAYADAWVAHRARLDQMLAEVRQQIELARDELAEAFRQQKTYEITQTNRERREREEADRKEQAFLDEVGLNIFRRREKGEGES